MPKDSQQGLPSYSASTTEPGRGDKDLINGSSDDQISHRLGLTRRTVQRCLIDLTKCMKATSRFELGFRLAKEVDSSQL